MTSFVHLDYPSEHPGVARAEALYAQGEAISSGTSAAWRKFKSSFDTACSLATLLMAAVVAALVVVADQLVDTWVDGHLFAAWVALWTLVFATLAVFAPLIKALVSDATHKFDTWRARALVARSQQAYLEVARRDPRVMADLRAAILRHEEAELLATGTVVPSEARQHLDSLKPEPLSALGHLRYI